MHEVLVNRLGGLSLPRKSVVRLTDRPDMTFDVYRGRKTTMQFYDFPSKNGLRVHLMLKDYGEQGPVVQSIVSLTSSLRGQLEKCFTTLPPYTLLFFVEKMREAFALQKLLTFFQQKILALLDINVRNFKETLTNDVVSFEQPGPGKQTRSH